MQAWDVLLAIEVLVVADDTMRHDPIVNIITAALMFNAMNMAIVIVAAHVVFLFPDLISIFIVVVVFYRVMAAILLLVTAIAQGIRIVRTAFRSGMFDQIVVVVVVEVDMVVFSG